ncbi:MAG: carbohydrate binding domain-containing protein [Micropruina sp.]|uniref:phage head spike fiber domain-containing protein n=1 Tax=Micropruina sp. TaxID=2737536 RepID=UPI0039E5C5EF
MVTLSGEDLTVHVRLAAESPSEDVAPGVWQMGAALPSGDDIATARTAVGQGFTSTLTMTLVRTVASDADATVQLAYRYLDAAEALLSSGQTGTLSVTATATEYTLALPAAPAGTVTVEIALVSAMSPPAPVLTLARTNLYTDPRCTTLTDWSARNSWTLALVTGQSGLPAGVATAVQVTCPSAGSAAHSGLNLGGTPASGSPTAGGVAVTPGTTYTISAYVRSTKAGTVQVSYRFATGGSWTAAAIESAAVSVAANTWTRVSYTFTAPAGCDRMQAAWRMPSSISWASGDTIRLTAVQFEQVGSLGLYFDGAGSDSGIPTPKSVQWTATANASASELYTASAAKVQVQALDSSLLYSATAEEVIGAALERPYRRSVADIWGDAQPLITAGTPGLLAGRLTFLCASLASAMGLDAVYRMPGLVTVVSGGGELTGLTHRAVGTARLSPELARGKTPKWTLEIEFREQAS